MLIIISNAVYVSNDKVVVAKKIQGIENNFVVLKVVKNISLKSMRSIFSRALCLSYTQV